MDGSAFLPNFREHFLTSDIFRPQDDDNQALNNSTANIPTISLPLNLVSTILRWSQPFFDEKYNNFKPKLIPIYDFQTFLNNSKMFFLKV